MDRDQELYNAWRRSQSPVDLEMLLQQLDPLVQAEVNRRAGSLSRSLLELQAKKLAVEAIRSFNPAVGVKLSTHVTNQLQKLSRVNYAHQNAARIPEHSMLKYHTVQIALEDFKADNGRDPSHEELADTLGWSPKRVEKFMAAFNRPELIESGDTPAGLFVAETHDPRVGYVYSSLSPRQQKIFQGLTGYAGGKKLSNTQIMSTLGITQGVLSYEKTKIREAFERVMQ